MEGKIGKEGYKMENSDKRQRSSLLDIDRNIGGQFSENVGG